MQILDACVIQQIVDIENQKAERRRFLREQRRHQLEINPESDDEDLFSRQQHPERSKNAGVEDSKGASRGVVVISF